MDWGGFPFSNAETQNRTGDTLIFSQVLYQLSYLERKPIFSSIQQNVSSGFFLFLPYNSSLNDAGKGADATLTY